MREQHVLLAAQIDRRQSECDLMSRWVDLECPVAEDAPAVLRYGALEINPAAHQVTFGLTPVDLCRQEYVLLAHLARDPDRVSPCLLYTSPSPRDRQKSRM